MSQMIEKASLLYGIGDALNARSFLVEYCKQKQLPRNHISIYTEKYAWMFENMGFNMAKFPKEFKDLTPFNNFGFYDIPKTFETDKCDLCIAKNAGIEYSFDVRTPLPDYGELDLKLPKTYVTLNTGYGDFSGNANDPESVCTKSWPIYYWERLVELLDVPVVQIGAGKSCEPVKNVAENLVNKTTLKQTAQVLRGALFHIDMEGGLAILNQHTGGKSVVLFGPTAIQNQGRSFNLNLSANTCEPCYEWGSHKYKLCVKKKDLLCKAHCMLDLKPEFVAEQIYKKGWL